MSSYLAPAHNETNPIARHDYYQTYSHIELPYTIGGSLFIFGALAMALCWGYKVCLLFLTFVTSSHNFYNC